MCGKIMTVLLIFIVLNCSMARYNGRLHCIVGVLPTCYKRKAATYFYPPGGTGRDPDGHFDVDIDFTFDSMTFVLVEISKSFVLYCVDASFISGRAIDCTIFENVISGWFSCIFLASK